MTDAASRMRAELTALWQASRPELQRRIASLESRVAHATAAEAEARAEAEREAHRLIGSIGNFGFTAASRAAAEVESLMKGGARLDPERLAALIAEIRAAVASPDLPSIRFEDKA